MKKTEYTFTGGIGNTVIDYVIGDEKVKEKVKKLEIKERRVDSDHLPVEVGMKGEREVKGGKRSKRKN